MVLEPEAKPVEIALIDRELVARLVLEMRLLRKGPEFDRLSFLRYPRREFDVESKFAFGKLHQQGRADPLGREHGGEQLPALAVVFGSPDTPHLLENRRDRTVRQRVEPI